MASRRAPITASRPRTQVRSTRMVTAKVMPATLTTKAVETLLLRWTPWSRHSLKDPQPQPAHSGQGQRRTNRHLAQSNIEAFVAASR